MLPVAPWLWPFFMHRFYPSSGDTRVLHMYTHINGDFGTRGFPGVFKVFFVDVVLNMARAASVLTIPLTRVRDVKLHFRARAPARVS